MRAQSSWHSFFAGDLEGLAWLLFVVSDSRVRAGRISSDVPRAISTTNDSGLLYYYSKVWSLQVGFGSNMVVCLLDTLSYLGWEDD